MSVTVPELRNVIAQQNAAGYDLTAITRSVRSSSWLDAARLQCWLAGRGSMDVPVHNPMVTIIKDTSSTFKYHVKPRYQTCRYAFNFVIVSDGASACTVTIPSGGTAHSVRTTSAANATPVTIFVDRAAQGTTETELSFDIAAPSSVSVTLHAVSIEALPRAQIAVDANDLGAERFDFWVRQPIASSNIADQILARQNDLRNACRRVGMFQFSRGTGSPWAITSTSFVDLFDGGIGALGRYLYSGDTERTLRLRILAKCSASTTSGTFQVNNDSQGSAAASIAIPTSTTSWTWLPAAGATTLKVDAEDNTTDDGLRGSSADEQVFQVKRTAGTGSVQIATVSLFDAAD